MNIREFSLVVVRFFGLWLLFQCIHIIIQTLSALKFSDVDLHRFITLLSLFNLTLYVLIGIMLTWKPQLVVNRIPLSISAGTDIRMSTNGLIFLCFSVAGLVFLVEGLKGLIYQTTTWLFASRGDLVTVKVNRAAIVTDAFEAAVGLLLLFRFKGIVRSLHRLWLTGRTIGEPSSEEDE